MLSRRALARMFTDKRSPPQVPATQKKPSSPVLKGLYQNVNSWFPKMIPRIARFSWLDLVVFSEIFFVGLMVYIHFIDV